MKFDTLSLKMQEKVMSLTKLQNFKFYTLPTMIFQTIFHKHPSHRKSPPKPRTKQHPIFMPPSTEKEKIIKYCQPLYFSNPYKHSKPNLLQNHPEFNFITISYTRLMPTRFPLF